MEKENLEIIGKKVGMTQVFMEDGQLIPVTVIEAGPCFVLQVKTKETDGYNAVQIGFGSQLKQRLNKPILGHLEKAGVEPLHFIQEFRTSEPTKYNVGDAIEVDSFEAGQFVDIIGTTKGRGFQGVVKRFNFSGGRKSHGSMSHRRGGSYGQCQWPGEVDKGKKMPGRMGGVQKTSQNLVIVKVIKEEGKHLMLVKGSIPGPKNAPVTVRMSKKKSALNK